jgi:hypothetical protein
MGCTGYTRAVQNDGFTILPFLPKGYREIITVLVFYHEPFTRGDSTGAEPKDDMWHISFKRMAAFAYHGSWAVNFPNFWAFYESNKTLHVHLSN